MEYFTSKLPVNYRPKLTLHRGSDDRSDDDKNDGSRDDGNDEPKVRTDLESLIDIAKPPPKLGNPGSGRPANVLIDNVLQCCYHIDNPEKHIYWCLGNCGMTYASQNRQQIV